MAGGVPGISPYICTPKHFMLSICNISAALAEGTFGGTGFPREGVPRGLGTPWWNLEEVEEFARCSHGEQLIFPRLCARLCFKPSTQIQFFNSLITVRWVLYYPT